MLIVCVLVVAGSVPSVAQSGDTTTEKVKRDLDSRLIGLLNASDRSSYADEHGLDMQEGRVRVVVELDRGTDLPAEGNWTVEQRYTTDDKTLVQALVSPDELWRLSGLDRVRRVRPPESGSAATADGTSGTSLIDRRGVAVAVGVIILLFVAAAFRYRRQ